MVHEVCSNTASESTPSPDVKTVANWLPVQQFRFLPESYLAAIGMDWDPGLDQLVYLRMFIQEETEESFQLAPL